jgi:putative peptidoglycan lipid II flippase
LAGLALEASLAWRYGSSGMVDAFRVANLLLAFANQIFAGALLPHVVIPLFVMARVEGHESRGWGLLFSLGILFGAAALIFVVWTLIQPGPLLSLLAPGLVGVVRDRAAVLLRGFAVAFVLTLGTGLASGALQAYRVFWTLPVSQVLFNLIIVVAVVVAGPRTGVLSVGVATGSAAMTAVNVWLLLREARRHGIDWRSGIDEMDWEGARKAFRLCLPLLVLILLNQWGMLAINRNLSRLTVGTLAAYGYAWKMLTFGGILPASLSLVLFPALAEGAGTDPERFLILSRRLVRMTAFLTIPVVVVLWVLRDPLSSFLLQRGAMDARAAGIVSLYFGILILGAPLFALTVSFQKILFAMQDMVAPALAMGLSMSFLQAAVWVSAKRGGAAGISWAYNLALLLQAFVLMVFLSRRHRIDVLKGAALFAGRLSLVVLAAGAAAWVGRSLPSVVHVPEGFFLHAARLSAGGLAALIVGFPLSRRLGLPEAEDVAAYVRSRLESLK